MSATGGRSDAINDERPTRSNLRLARKVILACENVTAEQVAKVLDLANRVESDPKSTPREMARAAELRLSLLKVALDTERNVEMMDRDDDRHADGTANEVTVIVKHDDPKPHAGEGDRAEND